jgi:bifunctional non-homologous end joining protein LigD
MKRPLIPMKAVIGTEEDLDRSGLLFEPKLDGIRALCYVHDDLTFYSRNGISITQKYPELQFRDHINAHTAILDGEIVVLDVASAPRFSLWQQGHEAVYIVFDILAYNGKDLLRTPLIERKEILEKVVRSGASLEKCLYTHDGHALWHEILKRHMEGVMAKDPQSFYYPGKREKVWLKIKAYRTLEALIIGYTTKRRHLSSLLLGMVTDEGTITYIGKVGTGFSEKTLIDLFAQYQKYVIPHPHKSVLLEKISEATQKVTTWMKPVLVCEIKYLEFTHSGVVRAPVFLRMRPDKNPQEILAHELT